MNITIIGGGIIGLCCAYYLRREGHDVTIIERGDITQGTSFGNAGYVSPSHIIPLASPGIVAKGLRWMLSSTSPFYIKPRLDADLLQWCFSFWRNATAAKVVMNAPPLNNFLQLSRELTSEIKSAIGNHFRMEEIGCFMLYKSAQTEKHEMELAQEAKRFNLETRFFNGSEIQAMEPQVEVKVRGGVLYPIDCHLHPGDLMLTMKSALLNMGVKLQLRTSVTGFESSGGKISSVLTNQGKFDCEALVLSNGSWLSHTAKQMGIKLLLQAGKGYSMSFEKVERNLRYPAILVDHRVAMTPMGPDLRMGGTMEISGLDSPLMLKRAQAIFNASRLYYPDLPVTFPSADKIWSGLRPLTPDGLPYVGKHSRYSNLVIAGGHAMLGLSLAAGTGKIVEEIFGNKKPSISIEAFRPERFG